MSDTSNPPPDNVVSIRGLSATDKKKAKAKFPSAIMEPGYTIVPSILLWGQGKLGLESTELNVLLQLFSHWWFAGSEPFLAKETIARRMDVTPRTIQRHLTSLEKKGFISRIERFKHHKGQDANGFDLTGTVDKLMAIAPEFQKVREQNRLRRARAEKVAG